MSSPLNVDYKMHELRLSEPLSTSKGGVDVGTSVFVRLGLADCFGFGEAAADPAFTGETQASVVAAINLLLPSSDIDPIFYRSFLTSLVQMLPGNSAAKAAIDIALHDVVAKLYDIPVYKLLGIDPTNTCELCYTIGLDSVDKMIEAAVKASVTFKTIKVKLGSSYDEDIVREVCSAVSVPVRVDVNGHWSAQKTLEMLDKVLIPYGVSLLEQPVPSVDFQGLKMVHDRSPIPVIADESLYESEGLPRIVDRCSGIDVKLMRCGGIQAALHLISSARIFGLKVMLGCMIESSLGITAAATLSPLADYADLDLHLRLENDPFRGVSIEDGRFVLSSQPGLGVELLEDTITWG